MFVHHPDAERCPNFDPSVEQVRAAQVEASEAVAAVQKAHAANVAAIKAHGSLIG
mgnify:CR=1 FL=1